MQFNPDEMTPVYGRRKGEVIGFDVALPNNAPPQRIWLSDNERIISDSAETGENGTMTVMVGAWNRAHHMPTGTPPEGLVPPDGPMVPAEASPQLPPGPPMPPEPPPDHTQQIDALDALRTKFPGVDLSPVSYDKIKITFPDGTDKHDAKKIVKEIDSVLDARKQGLRESINAPTGHPPGCQCPMCASPAAMLGGAVSGYKQQEQNAAAQNVGIDKHMEYRGISQPVSPMRPGRGSTAMRR